MTTAAPTASRPSRSPHHHDPHPLGGDHLHEPTDTLTAGRPRGCARPLRPVRPRRRRHRRHARARARHGAGVRPGGRRTSSSSAARPTPATRWSAALRAEGAKAAACACHVGHWDELDALVEDVYRDFGRVDVLVNNAGVSPLYEQLSDVSEELFDKVIAVNLKGPFRLAALVGERMVAGDGGSIINVSSTGAVRPTSDIVPYAAAKAGVNAMTVGLAHAFGPPCGSTRSCRARSSRRSRRRGTWTCSPSGRARSRPAAPARRTRSSAPRSTSPATRRATRRARS